MLDIRRSLEFLTEDPQVAQKIGLGAIILAAPVLSLAAYGYEVEVAKRVAGGEPQPLPEWNALAALWKQGAWLGLAYFVYGLPILGLTLAGMFAAFAAIFTTAASDSSQSGAGAAGVALFVVFAAIVVLALVYGLVVGFLRPALVAHYAQRGTFRSCFELGALWQFIRQDLGQYALLWGAELVIGWIITIPLFVLILVFSFIPVLGPLVVMLIVAVAGFALLLVNGHLVGQLLQARRQPAPTPSS